MSYRIYPVILAGGVGSRLWPLSREAFPKQFLTLDDTHSMLQNTLLRIIQSPLTLAPAIVICNEDHRFIVSEQLQQIGLHDAKILLEPYAKNTAPAIALAARYITEQDPDGIMLILPADHLIQNPSVLHQALQEAIKVAQSEQLTTFGITPTHPETGYGYIAYGQAYTQKSFRIQKFVEKPDLKTAQQYIDSGNYLWNSGMFVFKAHTYLNELKQHRPDIYQACINTIDRYTLDQNFIRGNAGNFKTCPSESIDYAVMEKTKRAIVIPLQNAQWNDIGSLSALYEIAPESKKDSHQNYIHGDVICIDSDHNFIYADSGLISTIGIRDCIIVQTADATLIADKSHAQDVKKIVAQLNAADRSEHRLHRQVHRPWGHYTLIESSTHHQVKRLTIKPNQKISLQLHHHRSEHWVILSGQAHITIGEKTHILNRNESIYIPAHTKHQLANLDTQNNVELIEVQVGDYLGEDDIIRFEDDYGRC